MIAADVGVIFGLGLWLGLTVAFQFEPKWLRVNFHGFVPSCRFFAPNPMITDARIYYCVTSTAEDPSPAQQWRPLIQARKWRTRPFWNPHQRLEKTAHSIIRQIMRLKDDTPHIELTVPYLRLLNLAQSRSREDPSAGFIRFIVTRHRGLEHNGRYVTFASRAHRIDDA